jgi:hypothetical protein
MKWTSRHGQVINTEGDHWLSRVEDEVPAEICEYTGFPRRKVVDPRSVAYWKQVHAAIEARFWAQASRPLMLTYEQTHVEARSAYEQALQWRYVYEGS